MTRRHYGIRVPKPRPTYTGPARAGAWSGSAFISVIVVILIVLGVILYGLSKTITDTGALGPSWTGYLKADGTAIHVKVKVTNGVQIASLHAALQHRLY